MCGLIFMPPATLFRGIEVGPYILVYSRKWEYAN